ncbi:MAG: MarR family transcriptional regulator, partial [Novosphingobium sp.]|nr:MarR family transcriptional regulator [Novosphingobium sp.]
AQVLVSPNRAERAIALGRVMARAGGKARVRELSEADRLSLIRLTEQVGQIAQKLDQMSLRPAPAVSVSEPSSPSAFDFADDASLRPGGSAAEDGSARLVRAIRPALPDPRLIRRVIRQRQLRARFFDGDLFADPAWDILLDLTAARAEHLRVSVTSLCIASGVPPTTALRWIGQMTDAGLLLRVDDEADRRRAFIALSDKSADAMARYFHELGAAGDNLAV